MTLKVNAGFQGRRGSRQAVVIPTGDERPLYYLNWVQRNIEKVSKATDGKVGYVHIPNMGVDGLNEFVKRFYPQTHKEGLVVDCAATAAAMFRLRSSSGSGASRP